MLNKQHARRWCGLLGQAAGALLIAGGLFFSAGALAETYSPTIVNGEDAALGELPWQILIRQGDQTSHDSNSCGATLAHPNWMITAAHCFPEQTENFTQRDISDPPALFVIAGIVDSSQSEQGVTCPVQRIILHPQYDPATEDNDIALLYVANPIECIHCRAISIVTAETEATAAPPGTLATVSGWGNRVQQITGQEGNQDFPTRLQKASVPIWDNQACISDTGYTEAQITANMLCAGYIDGSRDSCQGDSGGPLVVATTDGSGNVLLAGVVSWGTGCAEPGFTGVYTRVSRYTDWLAASSGGALAGEGGGGGDPATTLITHYYVSILERTPEPDGLAFWQGLVAERQARGEDVKPVFRWMAEFFFFSPEYLGRNTTDRQFITNLYLTFFQRAPDEGGYAWWLDQLARGMTRHHAMNGFLHSPEFTDFMEALGF